MNGYAVAYLGLVVNQLLAAVTFIVVYLLQPGWRASAVSRHILYWVASAAALDLSWLLLLTVRWAWLVYALLAAQALVGLVGWWRVWLVWRSRRASEGGSMITAKVKCTGKVVQAEGSEHEQVQLVFAPDYEDGRNKEWSRYTPSLSLTMSVLPEVADRFEPGQAFTLTFEPAE